MSKRFVSGKFFAGIAACTVITGASQTLIAIAARPALGGNVPVSLGHQSKIDRPHMDLAFCIDTTGSMQNEIDMVKKKTKSLVAQLSAGKPSPVVRVGIVAYRDLGDEYITKVFPFSDDIDKVVKDISDLKADGGGDGPEAVDRGLHSAINDLKWSADKHTAKLIFLIGDAGPHGAATDVDWRSDCKHAIADGIQINAIGCMGLQDGAGNEAESVFKTIAKLTDGKFENLAYRQEIVDGSGHKIDVVRAGSDSYALKKVAVGGSPKSWKDAVAGGDMTKMSSFAATAPATAPMMAAAGGLAKDAMSRRSSPRASFDEPAGLAGNQISRQDNNLDDIMVRDARERAAKVFGR